jgi:uncharacterized protein YfiM (DUF2279 family)
MKKTFTFCILFFGIVHYDFAQIKGECMPDTLNQKRFKNLWKSMLGAYIGSYTGLAYTWYQGYAWTPFHTFSDNDEWLQIDKAGHAYTAYNESAYGYNAMRWAGVSKKKALWLGGTWGIILQTPIEVIDGLNEGYGFSIPDEIANVSGSALFIIQQALWDEQIIKMKFSYSPTKYPVYNPKRLGWNWAGSIPKDYNGHTYWLSMNLDRALGGQTKLPKWLNLAFGYGIDGAIAPFENPTTGYYGQDLKADGIVRQSQYYLSLDIDLRKIKTKNRTIRRILDSANLLKIPAPTLEWNPTDKFKFHGIYF